MHLRVYCEHETLPYLNIAPFWLASAVFEDHASSATVSPRNVLCAVLLWKRCKPWNSVSSVHSLSPRVYCHRGYQDYTALLVLPLLLPLLLQPHTATPMSGYDLTMLLIYSTIRVLERYAKRRLRAIRVLDCAGNRLGVVCTRISIDLPGSDALLQCILVVIRSYILPTAIVWMCHGLLWWRQPRWQVYSNRIRGG
jgi:hypothetical protein